MKGEAAAAAKSEIMKRDKLGRQAGSGSQERNQEEETSLGDRLAAAANEGRQAWQTSRQRQPRAKS